MTIEDGRRLLISNLDLTTMYTQAPPGKEAMEPPPPLPSVRKLAVNSSTVIPSLPTPSPLAAVSLSAIEFFKVFCPTQANDLLLSTAARMSASFPYVSPAVDLPSVPPLRVVDAGYYDNYGVDLAAAWIFANRYWLEENTSGVLVVQVRDALSANDRFGYPATDASWYAWLLSGLQFFYSPIEGVAQARYSSSSFRNDALIAGLSDYFSERTRNRRFLTTAIFELSSRTVQPIRGPVWEWPGDTVDKKIRLADSSQATEVAMSWYLTVAERQAIDMAIPRPKQPEGFRKSEPPGCGTSVEDLKAVLGPKVQLKDGITSIPTAELDNKARRKTRMEELKVLAHLVRTQLDGDILLRERAIYVIEKELARAENYERLREVELWWNESHQRPK